MGSLSRVGGRYHQENQPPLTTLPPDKDSGYLGSTKNKFGSSTVSARLQGALFSLLSFRGALRLLFTLRSFSVGGPFYLPTHPEIAIIFNFWYK